MSVSTVIITLISYLIYKMKQFPKNVKETREATKKEGVFFRRHVPGLPDLPEADAEAATPSRFAKYNTLPNYFALLAFVIFLSLAFKDVFINTVDKWKRTSEIQKIHNLKDKKLLSLYDLEFARPSQKLKEIIPENTKALLYQKLAQLKNNKIVIVNWHNDQHVSSSLKGWTSFLTRSDLPFVQSGGHDITDGDIYIFLHAKTFNEEQKAYLDSLVSAGKSMLFVGPCGVLNKQNWCEQNLKLSFHSKKPDEFSKPTIFASRRNPGWLLPPGLVLPWSPQDESYYVTSDSQKEAAAYEATFKGRIPDVDGKYPIRAAFLKNGNSKLGWLAIEPQGIAGKEEAEVFYGESALIESLSWLGNGLHLEISPWKNGEPSGFVVSVDSESMIEGAFELWKVLERTSTPATFFVVSDQMKIDDRLTKINSPLFDIGSHSMDHSIMTTKKLDGQFNNIQDSRLMLEEKFGVPVKGFHPPEERFNEDTINAVLQNRMDYFVGDQRFARLAPLFLNSQLVYFPRLMTDDILIKRDRSLVSDEDILKVLNDDFAFSSLLGGMYYLNVHSQIFGQGFYVDVMRKFLEQKFENVWKTTFGEMTARCRDYSNIRPVIKDKSVDLINESNRYIKDLVIFINGEKKIIKEFPPKKTLTFVL